MWHPDFPTPVLVEASTCPHLFFIPFFLVCNFYFLLVSPDKFYVFYSTLPVTFPSLLCLVSGVYLFKWVKSGSSQRGVDGGWEQGSLLLTRDDGIVHPTEVANGVSQVKEGIEPNPGQMLPMYILSLAIVGSITPWCPHGIHVVDRKNQ